MKLTDNSRDEEDNHFSNGDLYGSLDEDITKRIELRKPDMDRDQYGQILQSNYQVGRLFSDDAEKAKLITEYLNTGKSNLYRLQDFSNRFGEYKAIDKK